MRSSHRQSGNSTTTHIRAKGKAPEALEPVINYRVGGDGSQFFRVLGARRDAYRVSASDERRRNRENWPRPFGLRRKAGHTSFSPSTVDPPQPSGSASSGPFFARNAARPIVNNRL